jgi:putative transposase
MRELGLQAIVRRRKPTYVKGKAHKVFPNLLNQQFYVDHPNRIWTTDFTYLPMADGSTRYNCTIIDLYDCSVVATLNGAHITADLAIATLQNAMDLHKPGTGLILHSDQGTQVRQEVA